MKEIVIELNDATYERLLKPNESMDYTTAMNVRYAIKNGKVLPKGHGELITKGQAVALVEFYQQNPQHFSFENLIDDIDKEKPLVEADKTESEEE